MILIVDDHQESGAALHRLLARQGFAVTHIATAKEALNLINASDLQKPLLVILDDMMPEMTGLEMVGVLRMNPTTRHLPVVMFSACTDEIRRESALSLGVLEWVDQNRSAIKALNELVNYYLSIGGQKIPTKAPPMTLPASSTYVR